MKIACIFPCTFPKLLSYFFSATENVYKWTVSIFLFQYKFIFHLETHYLFYETKNKCWFGLFVFFLKENLKCLKLAVISLFLQLCLYWCNCCHVEPGHLGFFLLIYVCKSTRYLSLLQYSKLWWCQIPKAPVSYYCPAQFIKPTEMTSARQKVLVALELAKNWSGHLKFKLRFVAGYYSFIWWFCF